MSSITQPGTTGAARGHPGTGTSPTSAQPTGKALYRVPEAVTLLSLSRSVIYKQIRLGRLRTVKEGSARLVPADAIADYVALLKSESEADR
jgi:excisionase family DNA binding protein